MEFFKPDINYDFLGKSRLFAMVSTVLVLASVVITGVVGLNYGIDFAGGYEIQVAFDKTVSDAEIKKIVNPMVHGDARVQRFGEESANEHLILVREHGTLTEEAKNALERDLAVLAGGTEKLLSLSIAESGERLKVRFEHAVSEAQLREVIGKHSLSIKTVSGGARTDRPEYDVTFVALADQIRAALISGLNLSGDPIRRVEFVGPQVGKQLRNQSIWAVITALFFILLYIGVRFDLFFAPGAIIALVHDVAITVGVFTIFQLEFSLPIIAAILAIVGYSLNDTIVVFDRIRENLVRLRGRDIDTMVNASINMTLSRTVLTSGTTLMVLLALLGIGGGIIFDFAVALVVGVVVGTYSSIFIAAPTYIFMRKRYGKTTTAPLRATANNF